jgi:phosphoglycolate phosphatase
MTVTKKLLITDVDNTLFDWFSTWHASFSAMLDETSRISGISSEALIPEFRRVFQKHRTSEYSRVLGEISMLSHIPRKDIDAAIEAYKLARARTLELYPTVRETLTTLRSKGVRVVAFTESIQYYTLERFRLLEMTHLIDRLYAPGDVFPAGSNEESRQPTYPPVSTTPPGETKPNPDILLSIVAREGCTTEECLYVGDSEMKDIAMANEAGIQCALATYGSAHFHTRSDDYKLLQRVSHWSPADVEREMEIKAKPHNISPTYRIRRFDDLLGLFK